MAEALAARGHRVHLVTYHLGEGRVGGGVRVHRIPDVPFYRRTSPGPTWSKLALVDPLLAWKVGKVVRAHPPDVIHAHHYEGLLVALPFRRRAPVVFDAHTLLESELPHYSLIPGRAAERRLGRWIDRVLPPRADHVIAVTERLRERLLAAGRTAAERITVIGNGVEPTLFRPTRGSGNGRTLVYAGNLAPYQGVEVMLDAVGRVGEREDDIRLVLALPPGARPDEVLGQAAERGLHGRVEVVSVGITELPGVLAAADVALHPRPPCDGLPMKLLNYMAAALPVVSFRGSARGLEHGRSAWIVEDGDVEGFAEGIVRLLRDRELARRLGTEARARVAREGSWERTATDVETVYRKLTLYGARSRPYD
jgi:glycosyltransferase involved in cell wall biosynthesis